MMNLKDYKHHVTTLKSTIPTIKLLLTFSMYECKNISMRKCIHLYVMSHM